MLQRVRLIQAIGKFDHMSASANIELSPLTLVYAENARGKTTLVSVLRSLASGDPLPIRERRRLGGTQDAQVVLTFSDEPNAVVFQNGGWSTTKPTIAVFDEQFVNDNVYSGLIVDSPQREGLHGLIVGAQGVSLLRALKAEVDAVEVHNQRLTALAKTIHPRFLRGLTLDQFCELPSVDDIDARIEEARKAVSAAQQQESIGRIKDLSQLQVAQIQASAITDLLSEEVPEISAEAERRITEHIARLGPDGENWLAQGHRIHAEHNEQLRDDCPYCAQPLAPSALAAAYSQHFSASYNELKDKIQRAVSRVKELFGPSFTERLRLTYEENSTKSLFWKEFADFTAPSLDVEELIKRVEFARDELLSALNAKVAAPLEGVKLSHQAVEGRLSS